MKLTFVVPAFLCLTLVSIARADLAADVKAALSSKAATKGQIGVSIVKIGADAASSTPVYESNAQLPLVPASNMKLLTTSAALATLGGDFRFKTQLLQYHDAVIVIGDGDPTLGDAELLKKYGWTTATMFDQWASALKSRGVRRVGDVIIDDSVFDQKFAHPNWPSDQLHKRYVAQVGGLNFNANCIDFLLTVGQRGSTVRYAIDPDTKYANITNTCIYGSRNAIWLSRTIDTNQVVLKGETNASNTDPISVTIHDPALFFGTAFAEALTRNGITVGGKVVRDRDAHTLTEVTPIAQHETPIEVVMNRANKDSMNLYAEALCKRIGAAKAGGREGSWQNGIAAVREYLRGLGITDAEASLDDGSGLSKQNRVSANAFCRVLVADFFSPNRELYQRTLAVGGVDGTLDNRFKDELKGRVFAKTGYVSNARCLSGYLKTKNNNWYAFSILVNGPVGTEGRRIQEQIVAAIDKND